MTRAPGLGALGIGALGLGVAVLFGLGLLTGAAGWGVPDALILTQLRLPRSALAALVGGGLGLSGAVLQGALRNPLADPGLLGISGCAALGAVIAFYWGLSASFPAALPLAGLVGAALGAGFLLRFAGRAASGPSLILAGVALSAVSAALLALALTLAPNPYALAEITFWLMGGLEDRSLVHLALAAPFIVGGCALLLRLGPGLDALALGEEVAATLGVPVSRTLRRAAIGVTLAVGAGAAVAGRHRLRRAGGAASAAAVAGRAAGRAAGRLNAGRGGAAAGRRPAGPRRAAAAAAVRGTAPGGADGIAWGAVPGADRPAGGAVIGFACEVLRLGGRAVLHDIAFAAASGEMVALCGPNGAGKTTLLRALAGLLPETAAQDPRRVAYLPQGASCAWGLTVAEVAALGRIPHGDRAVGPVEAALAACGLDGLRHARIDRISGGEARRAMLARAFATEPEVFLLDEPTADLDPAAAHAMMALLRRTAAAGRCVVVVLHALDLALRYADRMIVLQGGRMVADAPPEQALPAAAAAFGLRYGVDPGLRLLPPCA